MIATLDWSRGATGQDQGCVWRISRATALIVGCDPYSLPLGTLSLSAASSAPGFTAERQAIVLAHTTSVENSGLLAHILPQFTKETGITVHVVAQGTGQALATAAHDDADLMLVYDPAAEAAFTAAGHGWPVPRSPGTTSLSSAQA